MSLFEIHTIHNVNHWKHHKHFIKLLTFFQSHKIPDCNFTAFDYLLSNYQILPQFVIRNSVAADLFLLLEYDSNSCFICHWIFVFLPFWLLLDFFIFCQKNQTFWNCFLLVSQILLTYYFFSLLGHSRLLLRFLYLFKMHNYFPFTLTKRKIKNLKF